MKKVICILSVLMFVCTFVNAQVCVPFGVDMLFLGEKSDVRTEKEIYGLKLGLRVGGKHAGYIDYFISLSSQPGEVYDNGVLKKTDVSSGILSFGYQYRPKIQSRVKPFFGIGYCLIDFDFTSKDIEKLDLDSIYPNAGIDFYFTNVWAIRFDARYHIFKSKSINLTQLSFVLKKDLR